MMTPPPTRETPLQQAERHVREAEHHVAVLERILGRLTDKGDAETERLARDVLKNLQRSLEIAREHVERLRRN
jgi:ferritin-like metal-binding protein YciE